jgi:PAS domain-containing protein
MSRLALTITLVLLTAPAYAERPVDLVAPQDTEEWRRAEQSAREALEKLIRSFDLLLQTMPYGAPRVDEDGNIVIPRQHPHPLPPGGGRDGTLRT